MIVDDVHIPVTKEWIQDVLKLRVEDMGLKIEDLFLVTRCVSEKVEGDSFVETKYGKLRIFFRADLPKSKLALIFHRGKFNYPEKNVRFAHEIIDYSAPARPEATPNEQTSKPN